jgi:NAD(P)H-hydrate epimerase
MEKYTADKDWLVLSRQQVRDFDAWAINEIGVPGVVLMENAGRSCAELAWQQLAAVDGPIVCVFCGAGNNGGDGYVIARHLASNGCNVRTVLCAEREKVRGDARINLDILERLGYDVLSLDWDRADVRARVAKLAGEADLIVDALFGTGLQGALRSPYDQLVAAINDLGRPVLAVDIPSGLDCDTGDAPGRAIEATWTVTFAAVKKGFLLSPDAHRYLGQLYVASIGVEPSAASMS